MARVVGQKGQVVIAKEIRDSLGIAPGWVALQRIADYVEILSSHLNIGVGGSLALQRIVDDYVEIRSLAPYVTRHIPSSAEFAEAKERAWHSAAHERSGRQARSK